MCIKHIMMNECEPWMVPGNVQTRQYLGFCTSLLLILAMAHVLPHLCNITYSQWFTLGAMVTCGRVFIKILLAQDICPATARTQRFLLSILNVANSSQFLAKQQNCVNIALPLFVLLICYMLILQIIGRSIFRLRLFFMWMCGVVEFQKVRNNNNIIYPFGIHN